jgi:MraZ protein
VNSGAKNILLIGQYEAKLDSKGRLFFPSKFKKILGKELIVTRGYENSLILIKKESFNLLTKDIQAQPFVFGPARETARFILGNATEVTLDSQGRFLFPAYLKKYAQIKTQVIFLGLGNYVEIWNQKTWQQHQEKLEAKISSLSEKIIHHDST